MWRPQIAMLGYSTTVTDLTVDVTDLVDRSLDTQLVRVHFGLSADGGLTHAPDPEPSAVYVTKRPVLLWDPDTSGTSTEARICATADGKSRRPGACAFGDSQSPQADIYGGLSELQPDGVELPILLARAAWTCSARISFAGPDVQVCPPDLQRDVRGGGLPGTPHG